MLELDRHFPRYTELSPAVPVWCVTPGLPGSIHRFFDTSPISPSGRYLAVTRLPREDRLPRPGEEAAVVLVDLESGSSRVVATTRGWDTQLGAQAQWGASDSELYFNDLDTASWQPYGVKLDPLSGSRQALGFTVYMVSPDGRFAASPCLRRIGRAQPGYGVLLPAGRAPLNRGAPDGDGVYVTDTRSGETTLSASIRRLVEACGLPVPRGGGYYAFHVKWSPTGERLLLVLRWLPYSPSRGRALLRRLRGRRRQAVGRFRQVLTLRPDGSDARVAVPASAWRPGGHHPNWHPDGEHIVMNLVRDSGTVRFCRVRYDGRELETLAPSLVGSGHPSAHPDGVHLLTDSYLHEPAAFGDGTVPIRLVDLRSGTETTLARIRTQPAYEGPRRELRVDPHPAWDRGHRYVAFNGCPGGSRQVFVADLAAALG